MKERIDALLQRPQAEYLESILPARDTLLTEVEAQAAADGHPIADPEVAQLLAVLVRIKRPRRILEIGTNIGYSVIVMGRECGSDATVESIELDGAILATARANIERARLACAVELHHGAALEVIPSLTGTFDFVFIDCVKQEYEAYLDALLPRLEQGAVIVCDNLLWKGQVAEGPRNEGESGSTAALARFNRRITSDPRLTTSILPLGDGVGISVVAKT